MPRGEAKTPVLDSPDVAERRCLKCGKAFRSTWKGHRICKACAGNRRTMLNYRAAACTRGADDRDN